MHGIGAAHIKINDAVGMAERNTIASKLLQCTQGHLMELAWNHRLTHSRAPIVSIRKCTGVFPFVFLLPLTLTDVLIIVKRIVQV